MMLPQVYEGDSDYVFVCYSHHDRNAVLPIIRALVDEGYRVWYDDGIELGSQYPMRIANHVYGCAYFIMFVSEASLESGWCKDEVNYARNLGKRILPIYLADVELTRDLQMRLGSIQSLYWYKFENDDTFFRALFGVRGMSSCLTEEGASRRGVQSRVSGQQATVVRAREEDARIVYAAGVEPKGSLTEYSWAELKRLSAAIAEAGSDAEWKGIVRKYGLVDKGGRLQGDTKPFTLKDDTETSIRILGFQHDELAAGGKSGISFEFADVPARHRMNPTDIDAGGWKGSEMRTWLNDGNCGFFAQLPEGLRANVAVARKRANNSGKIGFFSENDTAVVGKSDDSIWLLSMSEVYGKLSAQTKNVPWSPATYDAEGTQYQLYANNGVTTTNYEFCKKGRAGSWWWLRSPSADSSDAFHPVRSDGFWGWCGADYDSGVSPGFCF